MKIRKPIIHLTISLSLAGLLLMQLVTGLWATSNFSLTRVTTGTDGRTSGDPSINSNGSKIAFDSDADFLGQGIPIFQREIWLYDEATMTFTRVTTGGGSQSPSINSDGSKIAFASNADFLGQGISPNQYEIWLYDTSTTTLKRITIGTSGRFSQDPSINSNGSKIAFRSSADFLGQGIPVAQYEIWLYDAVMMTVTRVTTAVNGRSSWSPSINSNGSKIAFTSSADFLGQGIPIGQSEIWLYDTDTMTVTRITTGTSGRSSWSPSINSDGSKIAFHSNADFLGQGIPANQFEIWLYDTDTMTLTRVTTGASGRRSLSPSINSNGSKIAFESDADFLGQGIPANQFEIWLYDTGTMTLNRVTNGASDRVSGEANINSDGSKIAFPSDADFLGQGIPANQFEIWLAQPLPVPPLYLPIIFKKVG